MSRNVDLCEMVPGAARPHQLRDFFFAAFFLATFFFATFFFATFFFAVFGFGTFLPFLRAYERAMAIACFLLFTVPPLPPLPLFSVPFFFRSKALFTSLLALREYLAIVPPVGLLFGTPTPLAIKGCS